LETTTAYLLLMIGIAKPTKATRPNILRRKDIKRKDKALQMSIGSGICEHCGLYAEQRVGHHKRRRRFIDTRWDMGNISKICIPCHTIEHAG